MGRVKHSIRYVVVRGVRYLRVEDVAEYVRELAGGEETDVRKRIEQGARNLAR
jgi:hypothetical protein